MALKEIVISGVSVMRQMGSDLLVFVIDATELLKFATTLRYEDSHQLGINRDLVHNRVKEIAKAMKQPDATMRGALQGAFYAGDGCEWWYDAEAKTLRGMIETEDGKILDGCFLTIDDGQHRLAALELLSAAVLANWQFTIQAGLNLTREKRIEMFLQDEERKRVARRLVLAMCNERGRFKSDAEKVAYSTALLLDAHPTSPFKEQIFFGQSTRVPKEMIAVTTLLNQLKVACGNGKATRLRSLRDEKKKQDAILQMFIAASQQWHSSWGRSDRVLGKNIAYLALLRLLIAGANFHAILRGDYRIESFRKAFEMGRNFKWEKMKGPDGSMINATGIADKLDAHLGNCIIDEQARTSPGK
ncbi:hypothetical protein HOI18_01910 [Candidatus Uhrbacteria bacterium]|jgi:DGQHR domain-containing protein|nr:hypothetical protein [Candidatus Uhrbacteria bacterium]